MLSLAARDLSAVGHVVFGSTMGFEKFKLDQAVRVWRSLPAK